jgi:hypothetical protein
MPTYFVLMHLYLILTLTPHPFTLRSRSVH